MGLSQCLCHLFVSAHLTLMYVPKSLDNLQTNVKAPLLKCAFRKVGKKGTGFRLRTTLRIRMDM